jgi:uncharacterized RDD family membrane protein YckC
MRPGVLRHLAAMVYDLLIVLAVLIMLAGLALFVRAGNPVDPQSLPFRLLLITGWWAYYTWSWTHGGQTVGMRAWRFVLRREDGRPVGPGRASLRFVTAWVSALAAGLGFLWRLVDAGQLTWHDRLSGTRLELEPGLSETKHRKQRHDQQ